MKLSFVLLVAANTALLALTAWTGHGVDGNAGFPRHFLLGMLGAFFTCFVHIVAFVYFIVQDKIIKQSVRLNGLDAGYALRVDRHKGRTLLASMAGIGLVLVVATLGALEGTTAMGLWHRVGGYTLPAINLLIAFRQYREIVVYVRMFRLAFGG